jgi:thymidylate kinase
MDNVIVILEGVDKCGKTTFAKEILKSLNEGIIWKFKSRISALKPRNIKDPSLTLSYLIGHYNATIELLTRFPINQYLHILDRFYPSEFVYSKIRRRIESFENKDLWKIENNILNYPHLLIYLEPSMSTLLKRLNKEPDDVTDASVLPKVLKRYHKFLKLTKLKTIIVNNDILNQKKKAVSIIKSELKKSRVIQ